MARGDHTRKTLCPESRRKERVKTLTGDWTRDLFLKTIDEEKGDGFNTSRIL